MQRLRGSNYFNTEKMSYSSQVSHENLLLKGLKQLNDDLKSFFSNQNVIHVYEHKNICAIVLVNDKEKVYKA